MRSIDLACVPNIAGISDVHAVESFQDQLKQSRSALKSFQPRVSESPSNEDRLLMTATVGSLPNSEDTAKADRQRRLHELRAKVAADRLANV